MAQTFDIPVDVPWTLVAASPDMMDTTFCDAGFPPPWQSSLAIYAFEPAPADLPQQLCNQKITYLKVTCSITGFQPTQAEVAELNAIPTPIQPGAADNVPVPLPNLPGDVVEDLVSEYFACYGVLLNVAVFPSTTTVLQQPTGTSQQYLFPANTNTLANPFMDSGLQFASSRPGNLRLARTSPRGPNALLIEFTKLTIDLPVSTNVVLKMSIQTRKGAVTAYQGSTEVYTTPLSPTTGVQDVSIATNSSITQVVIEANVADKCSLAGLSYAVGERTVTLDDYPHIIDFEPKTRDLYQAATDQGEILTASTSGVNTGKSLSTTSSSEMGLGLGASVSSAVGAATFGLTGDLTGKWGNTQTDSSTTQIDQSRERRETQGTTTNITQQYNLLTGYHAGTNRAAFLMLPRPHTLQATDYRTFVRGLRMIEGIQEFFLIVSRPISLPGICVEASLETGHFPEGVTLGPPVTPKGPPLQTTTFTVPITAYAPGGNVSAQYNYNTPGGLPKNGTATYALPSGGSVTYKLDTSQGGGSPTFGVPPLSVVYDALARVNGWNGNPPGLTLCPGVSCSMAPIGGDGNGFAQALNSMTASSVTASADGLTLTFQIQVNSNGFQISGSPASECDAQLLLNFTVYAIQDTSSGSGSAADSEPVVVSPFLITSRDLCVCINSCPNTNCVMIAPLQQVSYGQSFGALDGSGKAPSPKADESTAASAALSARLAAPGRTVGRKKATSNAAKNAPPPARVAVPAKSSKEAVNSQSSIVYETKVKLPRHLLDGARLQNSRTPAARELMHQIHHHLLTSWRLPQRRPHSAVGFPDSDYVCERLASRLPKAYLARHIGVVRDLPKGVVQSLGPKTTVGEVLKLELHRLIARAKVGLDEAILIRRTLLGFVRQEPKQ
jgi:hypothetical protein